MNRLAPAYNKELCMPVTTLTTRAALCSTAHCNLTVSLKRTTLHTVWPVQLHGTISLRQIQSSDCINTSDFQSDFFFFTQ